MWLVRNIIFYFVVFIIFILSSANYLNHFETPYSREAYLIAAGIVFLIFIFKLRIRWTGISTLNSKADKYELIFTAPLSKKFMNYTYLFNGSEVFISLGFGFLFLFFDSLSWIFSTVLLVKGVEGLIYLWINSKQKKFKIGINENAVVHNARGVYVLPFHELKSIEYKYDEFFFIYESGETLTLPSYVVEPEHTAELRSIIVKKATEKGIFYSDKLK